MKNPIQWLNSIRQDEIKRLKLANCNETTKVAFFIQVLEHETRVYKDFIFMPDKKEYMTKLSSIGFQVQQPQPTTPNKSEFVFVYNDDLNIGIHVVKEAQWNALTATIDAVKQLETPNANKFGTINIIFNALLTYKG